MDISDTPIAGCYLLHLPIACDERGSFHRVFCSSEFHARGLPADFEQSSISVNKRSATLRGLHYQMAPHEERKLVHVVSGSVFDVVLDLRNASPTYGTWWSTTLSSDSPQALYIPAGCAHGYQTLQPNTTLLYSIAGRYSPSHARTIRWDDPALNIPWPLANPILSERDRTAPTMPTTALQDQCR